MTARRLLAALLILGSGCTAVVRGSPLSSPAEATGGRLYLSTGSSPRPYRTLGFIQVRGYGVEFAGVAQVGDAALDHTLQGVLATEAAKLGGDGVIHIVFLDENPTTPAERASAMANTVSSGQVEQKARYVSVTGEVIQFLDGRRP